MKKYTRKTILYILFGVLFFLLVFFMFIKVFFPAYLSYADVCTDIDIESKYNVYIAGKVSVGNGTTGRDGTINIEDITIELYTNDPKVLRHEIVHVNQLLRGWAPGCDKPLQKYLTEVEAYSMQYFPDKIFYIFYDRV